MAQLEAEKLVKCQDAAQYLGVSVKTIRHWAQTGKLSGKKIGSRGDWRFTHDELSKLILVDQDTYQSIKSFISENAASIQSLANEKHIAYLGTKNATLKNLKRNREDYVTIVENFAKNLEQPAKGQKVFEKLGEQIAAESVEQKLTLEETLDGTTFLKQAFWERLEASGLLYKLTPHDLHTFNSTISQFTDIVTAKIVFAYEQYQNEQQRQITVAEEARDVSEQARQVAQEARQVSEDRFKMLADNIQNLAWMADADGYIYWYNKRWYDYTGTTPRDMEGWGWKSVHDASVLPEVLKRWKESIRKGVQLNMTFPLRGADGIFRPFLTHIVPVKNANGKVIHWTGTNTDVSEQLQAERRVIGTIESMGDAFFQIDKNWKIVLVNNSFEKLTHIKRDKAIAKDVRKLFPEIADERTITYKNYQKTMRKRVSTHFINHYKPLDFWTEVRAYPTGDGMSVFFRDISAEKKIEAEQQELQRLERERIELLRLNKVKDEFVALASHQLRTPASVVKQYLGILNGGYVGELSADQLKYINIANTANEREIAIIEDLLRTAQIDAKGYDISLAPIDLIDLVQDVIKQYEPTLGSRQQKLVFESDRPEITIRASAAELNTCLSNLIENASKYSEDGKQVTIAVTHNRQDVTIAVKDQGVGIAEQNFSMIFNKFTRVDNPLSDTVDGSGLGLYWVKRIVDLHKGSLDIESRIGKGTTISIGLPV